MRPSLDEVVTDLAAEHDDLDRIAAARPYPDWDVPTPAVGWSVRDTISHLAFFDEQATHAMTAPDEFRAGLEHVMAEPAEFMTASERRGRAMSPAEVHRWWRAERAAMLASFHALDPAARMPWYGPDMGAVSFCTARLMETWAHGQDVADAFGVHRKPTVRLRHIAHLGVATYRFSFLAAGREAPSVHVRVDLAAPDGSTWSWGPEDAANRVAGSALGFCLLVTQRRHIADTDVVSTGRTASDWVEIAQAFAGPAGDGRAPGLPAY